MSFRIRFTLPHGSTGHWAREYATREEAQRAIRERQEETGLEYVVEEAVAKAAVSDATPDSTAIQWSGFAAWQEDRVRSQEAAIARLRAELSQLRDAYDAARQDLDVAKRKVSSANTRLDCALVKGNRLRNVMSMLRSPDEDTRLLMHAAADEWDDFLRITADSLAESRQGPAKASDESKATP